MTAGLETTARVKVDQTDRRDATMRRARTGVLDLPVALDRSHEALVKVGHRAATITADPVDPIVVAHRAVRDPRVVRRAASDRAQTARAKVDPVEGPVDRRGADGLVAAGLIVSRGQIGAGARDQAEAGPGLKGVAQVLRQR